MAILSVVWATDTLHLHAFYLQPGLNSSDDTHCAERGAPVPCSNVAELWKLVIYNLTDPVVLSRLVTLHLRLYQPVKSTGQSSEGDTNLVLNTQINLSDSKARGQAFGCFLFE